MSRLGTFVFSVGLALLTWLTVGLLDSYLPQNAIKDLVIEAASIPGAVIASFFYPEGIHTGDTGVPGWVYAVVLANCLVYGAFWYFVLTLSRFPRVYATRKDRQRK